MNSVSLEASYENYDSFQLGELKVELYQSKLIVWRGRGCKSKIF